METLHFQEAGNDNFAKSAMSNNRNNESIKSIQMDLDRLFDEEFYDEYRTPNYVHRLAQDASYSSKESFLFKTKLLASNKFEQQSIQKHTPKTEHARRMCNTARQEFYRPNSTHQYLTATDVYDCTAQDAKSVAYGRPTRTTLLRARHRIHSAPINAYEVRRRIQNEDKSQNRIESRPSSAKDVYREICSRKGDTVNGEPFHSFLIGARYNSSNFIDRKTREHMSILMAKEAEDEEAESCKSASEISQGLESPKLDRDSNIDTPISNSTFLASELASSFISNVGEMDNIPDSTACTTASASAPLNVKGNRLRHSQSEPSHSRGRNTPTSIVISHSRAAFSNFVYAAAAVPRHHTSTTAASVNPLPIVIGQSVRGRTEDFLELAAASSEQQRGLPRHRRLIQSFRGSNSATHAHNLSTNAHKDQVNLSLTGQAWKNEKLLKRQMATHYVNQARLIALKRQSGVINSNNSILPTSTPASYISDDEDKIETATTAAASVDEVRPSRQRSASSSRPRSAWSHHETMTMPPRNTPRIHEDATVERPATILEEPLVPSSDVRSSNEPLTNIQESHVVAEEPNVPILDMKVQIVNKKVFIEDVN